MSFIELKNINKSFGKGEGIIEALKGIDLSIEKGEMVAIMGPSGSGKSTLLNILGFLDKPNEGNYIYNGKETKNFSDKYLANTRNKNIGFVVQNFALIEDYTVYENIEIPLIYGNVSKSKRKKIINELLIKFHIEDKKNKLPKELSGGQNQRVAIIRALVNNPEVILADEPTGALDQKTGKEVIELFRKLNNEKKTVIIITHDINVANMCDRTIHIIDGRIGDEL